MNKLDNLVEYSDPEIYDLENGDFEPDGLFILSLAKKLGGAVLELGCGTGRVTLPLAQNGVEVVGLDVVAGMLERARQKAGLLPVEWVLADVRTFQLGRKFRLIFESGSVFRHMLTLSDQEAYLAKVLEHLEDNGRFVVSVLFPRPHDMVSTNGEEEWFSVHHPNGYEIRVSGVDSYDALRQVKMETAYRRWTDEKGREIIKVAPLSLRLIFPQEMEALLHYNGFEIEERYGDVDQSPLTNDSRFLVYVCRKSERKDE